MELVYKKKYQTCLQMLDEYRAEHPELKDETLGYAGVLDPMAEGWVSVLIGKAENQNRVYFTEAKKRYEFEVLIGFSTDSDDLLGLIKETFSGEVDMEIIKKAFLDHPRKFLQPVHMFSNKKIKGEALWSIARRGEYVPDEDRPKTEVEIYELSYLGKRVVTKDELLEQIELMEKNIRQGFRKEDVSKRWREVLVDIHIQEWQVLKFSIFVSKGFYVRKFVEDISKQVGLAMVIWDLKRTEVQYL